MREVIVICPKIIYINKHAQKGWIWNYDCIWFFDNLIVVGRMIWMLDVSYGEHKKIQISWITRLLMKYDCRTW